MYKYKINQKADTDFGEGVVIKQWVNFHALEFLTMSPDEWLSRQLIPITDEQLKEPWYSIQMEDGSIWKPESRVYEI